MPKTREEYNEYMRTYMLARYHRVRQEAIMALGGKCVDCGSEEDLEFDHVDRLQKLYGVFCRTLSKEKLEVELAKCVLRCDNCHNERTKEQLSVEHGGGASGKKKLQMCSLQGAQERVHEKLAQKQKRSGTIAGQWGKLLICKP